MFIQKYEKKKNSIIQAYCASIKRKTIEKNLLNNNIDTFSFSCNT